MKALLARIAMHRPLICLLLSFAPVSLTGCDAIPVFPASQPPAVSVSAHEGSLRGFVYGAEGRVQVLRGARVHAGSVTTLTGSPADLYHEAPDVDAVHERDGRITVWHDFNDGLGLVPAERRSRPGAEPVYLRAGEFLLEGLPDGPVSVTASQCDMTSPPLSAHVTAGHTTDGLALALPAALPMENGDSTIPRVVTWHSSLPVDGFVVSLAPEGDRLSYQPSPPNLTVTLQTPPARRGITIVGIEIEYVWRTADGTTAAVKSQRLPIAPLLVPSASTTCPGAPVSLQVPLGTAELADVFIRQGAGQVVAKVRFIDQSGFEVQGMLLESLEVATNLRRL